jgi:hypothetical protein
MRHRASVGRPSKKSLVGVFGTARVNKSDYISTLPNSPYCTERKGSLIVRKAERAVNYPLIQPNWPDKKRWMAFDLDFEDSWMRWDKSGLPKPNYIAVNRMNGHAHVAYMLASPVSFFSADSDRARNFYRAIERAFRRIGGGDPNYSGFITKNPVHPKWDVDWGSSHGYELSELNDGLDRKDKMWTPRESDPQEGSGRNDTLFHRGRKVAYRNVLKFKKDGNDKNGFMELMVSYLMVENSLFSTPLWYPEVRGIAKSIVKKTWEWFTVERFSAIQSARASKRWVGLTIKGAGKPWLKEGISRATYYRRRASS